MTPNGVPIDSFAAALACWLSFWLLLILALSGLMRRPR